MVKFSRSVEVTFVRLVEVRLEAKIVKLKRR